MKKNVALPITKRFCSVLIFQINEFQFSLLFTVIAYRLVYGKIPNGQNLTLHLEMCGQEFY